jgi:hypothetical protein
MPGPISQSYEHPDDDPPDLPEWAFEPDQGPDPEPPPRDYCPHCGKEFEDFSDMGCERCDRRHPGFGTIDPY